MSLFARKVAQLLGLEGIRDRVNRLDGTFEIESKPGAGTKATVQLKMKDESTGNEFKA